MLLGGGLRVCWLGVPGRRVERCVVLSYNYICSIKFHCVSGHELGVMCC
jgi:hypothetical protein